MSQRSLGVIEALQFSEEGAEVPEQTLLRVGKFKHPKHGVVEITPAHMRSFVKNHEAKVRRVDDALDFGHNAGGPAAAWLTGVRFDEKSGKLLFKPEWTPTGRNAVKNREYKYLSADFDFDYEDNETGKKFGPTLNGAGLTNRPFVKGMEAIQLSEGDCEMMTLEQALQEIERLKAMLAQGGQQQPNPQMQQMQQRFSEVETENKTLKEQVAGFQKKEDERKAADAKAAKSAQFDELVKSGKACEAQREIFMADTFDAVKFAEAFVPAAGHNTRLSEEDKEKAKETAGAQGAEAKIIKLAETVEKSKQVDRATAIGIVLSDPANKALVDEYNKNVQLA